MKRDICYRVERFDASCDKWSPWSVCKTIKEARSDLKRAKRVFSDQFRIVRHKWEVVK